MTPQERRQRIVELRQELGQLLLEEANEYGANLDGKEFMEQCRVLKVEGKVMEAIHLFRRSTGCGLIEAKNSVLGIKT